MIKALGLFLVVLLVLQTANAQRSIDDIIQDLEKYCPFFGFQGVLQCPTKSYTTMNNSTLDSQIISGFGYDRVSREVRYPVLPSKPPSGYSTANYQTYEYTDVSTYLNFVFAEKANYQGGIYVLEDNFVSQFASLFSDYRINMLVTQKQYDSYATAISSYSLIPEFLELLQTLPPVYNSNNATLVYLYRSRIIDIFGTDVSISSTHGGIFFQQSVVKTCYSGNVAPDMEHEIDTTINHQPPGPLAYLQYRSLGIFDVLGGNPELPHTNYGPIIASFAQNPAITSFNSVPLWQVVPANYRAALQAAINDYTNEKQVSINALTAQIEGQKVQSYKNPQTVAVYGRQTAQYSDYILVWNACPYIRVNGALYTPRCTYEIQYPSFAAGGTSVIVNGDFEHQGILHYESQREAAGGTMRIDGWFKHYSEAGTSSDRKPDYSVDIPYSLLTSEDIKNTAVNVTHAMFALGNVDSAYVHTGCVDLLYLYVNTMPYENLYFTACIDCLPVVTTSPASFGMKNSDLECVCAGF
jgi:hypothetical protein